MKKILLVKPKYLVNPIDSERRYWEVLFSDFKDEFKNQFRIMMFLTHERRYFGEIDKAGIIYSVLGKTNAYQAMAKYDFKNGTNYVAKNLSVFTEKLLVGIDMQNWSRAKEIELEGKGLLSKFEEFYFRREFNGSYANACFEFTNPNKTQMVAVIDSLLAVPLSDKNLKSFRNPEHSLGLIVEFGTTSLRPMVEEELALRGFEEYIKKERSNMMKGALSGFYLCEGQLAKKSQKYNVRLFQK